MDTLNLILQNLHWYILALSVLVYAFTRVIEARARNNPATTWEDEWLPTLHTLSDIGAKGVDLLADVLAARGDSRLKNGRAKLAELQRRVAEWEALWRAGKRQQAITEAWAWYVDLQGKAARLPFGQGATPATGSAPASTTARPAAGVPASPPPGELP